MRALGLDWGERRVGVALSDSAGTIATPYEVIEHHNNEDRVVMALRELIEESGAEVIVLGLPRGLAGQTNTASAAMMERGNRLEQHLGLKVEFVDERLTTVSAHASLRSVGMREKKRRQRVDQLAATILLQAWLDSQSS